VLHFYLNIITNTSDWLKSLSFIQVNLNNSKNVINKISNETIYEFSSNVVFLLNIDDHNHILSLSVLWIEVTDTINFVKINVKYHYDWKHQSITMMIDNYMLLQLHHDYSILIIINKKLEQQYVRSFQIIKKIKWLVYKLNISSHWCVHSVFTVTQLKSCSSLNINSYQHSQLKESFTVFVKENINE